MAWASLEMEKVKIGRRERERERVTMRRVKEGRREERKEKCPHGICLQHSDKNY
jgi:hypothetical protein